MTAKSMKRRVFGDLGSSLVMAREVFGDIGFSLLVAGAVFGDWDQLFEIEPVH